MSTKKIAEIENPADAEIDAAPTFDEKAYMEERIPFRAFKDGEKYKDDIVVTVNGETCVIKRGVPVLIKRKFYEVIRSSESQDLHTADLITAEEANRESRFREANYL